jgi:proteic killer suppression protein
VVKSFKSKPLADLWVTGRTSKIDARMHKRLMARLTTLDRAKKPDELNIAGYKFHALHGFEPVRYSIHVNGPWCITFEFQEGNAFRVDFEQYH